MGGKYGNGERISRDDAGDILMDVAIEIFDDTERLAFCGSYRREKETCGDGDIVVLVPDDSVWTEIVKTLDCEPLTTAGKLRKGVTIVREGFQIDVNRAMNECELGAMVLFATGSGTFNQATRTVAKRKGYRLNRYGLHDRESGELVACGEREILEKLGFGWIAPKDRVGWGKPKNLEKRFWLKVDRKGENECWEWTGSIRKKMGYGVFWMTSDNNRHAHRVCWELVNGPIPDGKLVLHHCDNRRCVNPAHLFLGTQSDNVNDRVKKGRSACGESHGMSKLTESDVHEIRWRIGNTTLTSLAKEFGLSVTHVWNIVHRKNWTHV